MRRLFAKAPPNWRHMTRNVGAVWGFAFAGILAAQGSWLFACYSATFGALYLWIGSLQRRVLNVLRMLEVSNALVGAMLVKYELDEDEFRELWNLVDQAEPGQELHAVIREIGEQRRVRND